MQPFFIVITVLLVVGAFPVTEIGVHAENSKDFAIDSLASQLNSERELIEGYFLEDKIVWLSDSKIDRKLLHSAAWKAFEENTALERMSGVSAQEVRKANRGKMIMLDYLALCANDVDYAKFKLLYIDTTQSDDMRFQAFFAHLFSVGADGVEQVVGQLSEHSVFPYSLRKSLFQGICLVYQWSVPDKRKAIAAAFKNVIKYEDDDKWMFLICDDMLKFFYEDYARSEYRRDFIGQFLKTPFNENESKRLKPYFEQAIAECTNPKVKVKPSLEKDYHYPPYISYEETILAGKGIPEIKKMVDEFRNGGDVLQETEKTKQTLSAWTISTTTAFVIVVVVGVITVWRKIRKRE